MKPRFALDPGHAEAHQGLAYVLAELGDEEGAQWHRRKGFQDRPVVALPYRGRRAARCRCCCWFRRLAATFRPAICWTTASSRRSWWCPSFTISKCRCRRIRWCSMPSAMPTWPRPRWLPRSPSWL